MVEKKNSHPFPACVRNLTSHSELHCHALSCAAANYKHIPNCPVQHWWIWSSQILPPWSASSAGKGPRHKPLSILVMHQGQMFPVPSQHRAAASCSMGTTIPAEATPASGVPGMRIQEEMRVPRWHKTFYHRMGWRRGKKKKLIFLFEEFLLHLLFYSIRI